MRLRRPPLVMCCVLLLAPAGCGRQDEGVPAACREGSGAVRRALGAAPGPVRLDGTPISDCLGDASDGGELRDVGTALVGAAADLAEGAARHPDGREAVQLGYLVGAVRRGAPSAQGVNSEMVRRLEQEALRVDMRSAAFRRGERAGRRGG